MIEIVVGKLKGNGISLELSRLGIDCGRMGLKLSIVGC